MDHNNWIAVTLLVSSYVTRDSLAGDEAIAIS